MEGKNGSRIRRHSEKILFFLKKIFFYSFCRSRAPKTRRELFSSKRMMLYASAAIIIKTLSVVFILFYPLSVWLLPEPAEAERKQIILLTNEFRSGLSLPPLLENEDLDRSAYAKVRDMFLEQYFSHVGPEGQGLDFFFKDAGYDYSIAGENLAMGFSRPAEAVAAWIKSPGHYSNLADKNFSQIGVGLAEDIFEKERTILIAQHFGRPAEKAVPAASIAPDKEAEPRARVFIDNPTGRPESLIKAQAVLPEKTKAAALRIDDRLVPLSETEGGNWSGQEIIFGTQNDSVSSVTVDFVAFDGGKKSFFLAENDINLTETSLWEQYSFMNGRGGRTVKNFSCLAAFCSKILLLLPIFLFFLSTLKQKRPLAAAAGGAGLLALLWFLF